MPFTLETIYLGAAVLGGALLLIQIGAALLGGGDVEVDADVDVDAADAGGHLSFRTVVAFVTFFGVAGMAARSSGVERPLSVAIALVAGSLAFWLVGLAMLQLSRLRSSGNVEIRNAVGQEAKVYLAVPAAGSGTGTVTVAIQGRTVQFKAVTSGEAIATGRFCKVVGVHAGDTLEVVAT